MDGSQSTLVVGLRGGACTAKSDEPRRSSTVMRSEIPLVPATPRDALKLAMCKWCRGERLDISVLARELSVSRGTVFRWIGTRENLYAEVICDLYAHHHARLVETAEGGGMALLETVVRKNLAALSTCSPLYAFIESNPELALRLLTSPAGAVHRQAVDLQTQVLCRVIAEADIAPQLDLATLAHITVRIGEAFLYTPAIGGYALALDKAVTAIRLLVSAERGWVPKGAVLATQSP